MKKQIIPEDKVPELTDKQLLAWDSRVIPLSMVGAVWEQITGRKYNRSTALQARMHGRIVPMGKNRGRLYFWRDEVERAVAETNRGRPKKAE